MLEGAIESMRAAAGVVKLADLGVLHEGQVGVMQSRVSAVIELFDGAYYLAIEVRLEKGPGFRRTRVVKWPYSRIGITDLAGAITDLEILLRAPAGPPLADKRTGFGKWFDRLLRRNVFGSHAFRSIIDTGRRFEMTGMVEETDGQRLVNLTESTPPRGFTMAQLPQAALRPLVEALKRLRDGD